MVLKLPNTFDVIQVCVAYIKQELDLIILMHKLLLHNKQDL